MSFEELDATTTMSTSTNEFGFIPSIHTSFTEYDIDNEVTREVFRLQGYLFDPINIDANPSDVFDSISCDMDNLYMSAFHDKHTLRKIIKTVGWGYDDGSIDLFEIPRCLVVDKARNYSESYKRIFADTLDSVMTQIGAGFAIFMAGNILKDDSRNVEDLCKYYESIDGVTLINKEYSTYIYVRQ